MNRNSAFAKQEKKDNILSIRLSADGFSFSILDQIEKKLEHYQSLRIDPSISLTANLKQAITENEILTERRYREVNILLQTSQYTPIPIEHFKEKEAEILYNYTHLKTIGETVMYDTLPQSGIVLVFAIEKSMQTLLEETYLSNIRIRPAISPVIEHTTQLNISGGRKKLYANIQRKHMDLIAYEGNRLLLASAFPNRGDMDCIYYISGAWKNLAFDQWRDELYLISSVSEQKREEIMNELRNFLKQVFYVNPQTEWPDSEIAEQEDIPYDIMTMMITKTNESI